ncbi:MAG: putative baseplate assembly protein [Waterburya sp.]
MSCLEDPQKPFNRPGLPALTYRLGDYNSFRARLLDRLICKLDLGQAQEISLQKLTTRASEDTVIALLDACAVVADVLTFYQERIINEGYILTATERQSVLEMARTIGYELDPGVAASTFLAFTMDDAPNSPLSTIIPPGTQIMSVPGQDELPQTFETTEEFIARIDWNALKPRSQRPQKITTSTRKLYLDGINTQLQPGDSILLMDGDSSDRQFYFLTLDTVQAIAAAGHTLVTWNHLLPEDSFKTPPRNPTLYAFRQKANLFGHNAPRWSDLPNETKVANGSKVKGGVYIYELGSNPKWKSINQGLNNFDVRCLVANSEGYLFAGTANGIFRSQDNGETWTAVNSGLNNTNVQTILIAENNEILAGTAADGVFLSTDNGGSWSSIGIGEVKTETTGTPPNQTIVSKMIPNTVVRSLAVQQINVTPPTITSDGRGVRISPGDYYLSLRVGDLIQVGNQTKTIIAIARTILFIDSAFSSNITVPTAFIATRPNSPPRSSNITIDPGRYILVSTDDGVYKSQDGGKNWKRTISNGLPNSTNSQAKSLGVIGNLLFLKAGNAIYQSNNQGNTWDDISALDTSGTTRTIYTMVASPETIFVGASDGIYQWNSNNWQKLSLSQGEVKAIAVNRSRDQNTTNRHLFAFTTNGIFKSTDNGSNWHLYGNNSTNIDLKTVTACVTGKDDADELLFAGTLFTGFDNSSDSTNPSNPSQKQTDWIDFEIPKQEDELNTLYLDTLYPRIPADTWMVLKTGDRFTPFKIKDVSAKQQKQFTLDSKVTRLSIDKPQNNGKLLESFQELRESIVFAQSEIISLAPDPLTIPAQQSKIFSDPIIENRVFLSQYVVGLQPQQRVIISGKRMRIEVKNIAGVAQLLETSEEQWIRTNTGLTNTNATCLAGNENNLFIGTTGGGVFYSTDDDKLWKSTNKGITNLNIQTLTVSGNYLLAGTAGGGVFCLDLSDLDGNWEEKNENLIHRNVQVLIKLENDVILAGTINGGVYRWSDNGEKWSQTYLDNTDVRALCELSNGRILAGTVDDGVWRSQDEDFTWQPVNAGLIDRNITNVSALLAYQNNASQKVILAGTAGSGIFRLTSKQEDDKTIKEWKPISLNPTDLNINCLTYDTQKQQILAGTVSGGVFISLDDGDRWKSLNKGLTCVDEQINPTQKVNTNIQALAEINQQIFAVGTGILISADGLYTVPIRSGDRLQVLAPPEPLGSPDPDVAEIDERKWLLEDANGFQGLVFTANSEDTRLESAAKEDRIVSELAVILKPPFDRQEPVLKLVEPIQNIYDPETVEIYANVVAANHGETITEVIGSGDGTATNQKFVLQKPPLTHVAASTASGFSSTLQVRVNEVLWQEVPSLYQRQPQEQVYITRIADDRTATITFGDGKSGNRLPSGRENIVATYRTGIGLEGQVNANQLTLLKTRPLGISQVNNPLPATGAADPETMAEAQVSAPLTTRTLDRIVSLQDYEDFARAFAGIGKAQAIALWTGNIQQVHITIGAIGGKLVLPETALYENLVSAIENSRDPLQQVQVDSYELLQFNLAAKLTIDPRYLADKVIARVETTLKTLFAFEERNFGQAVTAAEAIAIMQSSEGVIAVDLDTFHRLDLPLSLEQSLPSLPARWDTANNRILPAQLLLLNPAGIRLNVEVVR